MTVVLNKIMRNFKHSGLLICLLVHLVGGIVYSVQAPFFYPAYAQTKSISLTKYSGVFCVYEVLILALYPLVGALLTNIGAHICVAGGLFCLSYSCVGFGYLGDTEDATVFLIISLCIRGLEALGSCAYTVGILHVVCKIFPLKTRIVLSSLNIAFACGIGIGTIWAWISSKFDLLDESFIFLGGFLVIFGILAYFVIPKNTELNQCKDLELMEGAKNPEEHEKKTEFKKQHRRRPSISCEKTVHFFTLPGVWPGIFSTIVGMVSLSFLRCTRGNMIDNLSLPTAYASVLSLLCPATNIAATLGWLHPIDKGVSPKKCIILGAIIHSAGILLIGPACRFLDSAYTTSLFALGQIFVGCGSPPVLTAAFTDLVKNVEKGQLPEMEETLQAVTLSWKSAYSLGNSIGPMSGYFILKYFEFSLASFFIYILNISLIIVIAYVLFEERKTLLATYINLDTKTKAINYKKESHFVQPQSNVIFFPSQVYAISEFRCPYCTHQCIQVAENLGVINKKNNNIVYTNAITNAIICH